MSEIKVDSVVNAGGDNDSGIDLSTNDVVKVNIANAQVMKVTSTQTDIKVSASRELNILKDSSDDFLVLKSTAPDASNNLRTIELVGSTISFATGATSGTSSTERTRIDSSGLVLIGNTVFNNTDNAIALHSNAGSTGHNIQLNRGSTDTKNQIAFSNPNGQVGTIQTAGSGTSYNTSSDYRLKENVVTDWDATTRLKQLKPSRFNFIADADTTVDGFLAHEVSDVVPEAITGTKDAVDENGNPEYQGIDQSKLVPLLVKTIQELEARITALESE